MEEKYLRLIYKYGDDILKNPEVQKQKKYIQHGCVSVYEHCVNVGYVSLLLADALNIRVHERELVRGALLHDYFLYDWHIKDDSHRFHGFTHALTALKNASRDYELGKIERDIIKKHMFPLNPALPRCRETVIVCIADKICAVYETVPVFHIGTVSSA